MDKIEQKGLEGNVGKICLMNFLDGLWFPMSVFVIFLLDNGMSLTQAGLILGAYSIMPFFLDLPSSILADKHSRKSMLILMSLAYLFQNIFYFFGHSFAIFFLASCFNGIGTALSMGISSAFVYDTLLSIGKEKNYEKAQSKVMVSLFAGRLLASAGVFIYLIDPRMVFSLATVVTFAGLCVAFSLKEPPRQKSASKPLLHINEGFAFLFKHKIVWHTAIVFSLMAGVCGVLFDYYQPVMKAAGISVAYFGMVYFVANSFSFAGAFFYPKLSKYAGWKKIMLLYLAIALVAALSFATQSQFSIIAAVIISSLSLGLQGVFISNIINKIAPSTHRAIALSIQTQMQLIFNFILLMAVSIISDKISIAAGMILLSVFVAIAGTVFLKLAYKGRLSSNILI